MVKNISSRSDGTVKLSGGDQVLTTSTLIRKSPDRGEEQDNLLGDSDGSSSTSFQDSSSDNREARNDFWSISGNCIYRGHVEPRVKLYLPGDASFPITICWRDQTNKCDHGCDAWTPHRRSLEYRRRPRSVRSVDWIHNSPYWTKNLQMGWHGLGKKQTTSRPNQLRPEIWREITQAAQPNERQKMGDRRTKAWQ